MLFLEFVMLFLVFKLLIPMFLHWWHEPRDRRVNQYYFDVAKCRELAKQKNMDHLTDDELRVLFGRDSNYGKLIRG